MAINEIKGQIITFDPKSCNGECVQIFREPFGSRDYTPETDVVFQIPSFTTGDNLLYGSSIDLEAAQEAVHSDGGTPVTLDTAETCGIGDIQDWDDVHVAPTAAGADGFYFFKYEIGEITVNAANSLDGSPYCITLYYLFDVTDPDPFVVRIDACNGEPDGSAYVGELTFATDDASELKIAVLSQDNGTGNCFIDYSVEDITTEMWKMWVEETVTLEDNKKYRLAFTNTNTTSTRVQITDESSTVIYDTTSDSLGFDKIFQTGTLPGGKTVTIRFDFSEFIETDSATWYQDILTSVSLKEVCDWTVATTDANGSILGYFTETIATTTETVGTSYDINVEYSLDVSGDDCGQYYGVRAINGCDSGETYDGNCICIGDAAPIGTWKYFSWTPTANKQVNGYVLDYVSYPTTEFLWAKADLQDLTIEEERIAYRQSDGYFNVPYAIHRDIEILQVWPISPNQRRMLAMAMQDTFYIDGVAYQKIDEDEFAPQFSGRHESAMRIPVARIGGFSVSRNA